MVVGIPSDLRYILYRFDFGHDYSHVHKNSFDCVIFHEHIYEFAQQYVQRFN